MKDTNLNSALLATDARGRKHVPIAVIAVILVHIALFLILLVAAGCRAKARAEEKARQEQEMAARQMVQTNIAPAVMAGPTVEGTVVRTPALEPAPVPRVTTYIVQPGDNLGAIARRHRTTVEAIKEENDLRSDFIKAGQELRVRLESPGQDTDLASR